MIRKNFEGVKKKKKKKNNKFLFKKIFFFKNHQILKISQEKRRKNSPLKIIIRLSKTKIPLKTLINYCLKKSQ